MKDPPASARSCKGTHDRGQSRYQDGHDSEPGGARCVPPEHRGSPLYQEQLAEPQEPCEGRRGGPRDGTNDCPNSDRTGILHAVDIGTHRREASAADPFGRMSFLQNGGRHDDGAIMTSPRNCRRCGTALPPDVRWCGLCLAPAFHLSPRAPLHARGTAGRLILDPVTSRWVESPSTLPPTWRVAVTVLMVIGFAPTAWLIATPFWPLAVVVMAAYGVIAILVLRDVWRPVRLDEPPDESTAASLRGARDAWSPRSGQ